MSHRFVIVDLYVILALIQLCVVSRFPINQGHTAVKESAPGKYVSGSNRHCRPTCHRGITSWVAPTPSVARNENSIVNWRKWVISEFHVTSTIHDRNFKCTNNLIKIEHVELDIVTPMCNLTHFQAQFCANM